MSAGAQLWWWPGGTDPAARPLLFFPPAGADQTIAAVLVPELAGVRFGVLRMPGRGVRRHEPAPQRLDDAVAAIAEAIVELGGPAPVLAGHSFGGLIAFAVAQELQRHGAPAARLVAVASTPPHAWADHLIAKGLHPDPEPSHPARETYVVRRVAQLLADGAVPAEIAEHPELGATAREALTADVRMSLGRPDTSPIRTPITSVIARDDLLVARDSSARWREAGGSGVEEIVVPGGHFFYQRNPKLLARLLIGELTALDGAYT